MSETNRKPENPQAYPGGIYNAPGMTLRDYFAAHAPANAFTFAEDMDEAARLSYVWADAMLKARGQ